MFDSKPNFLGLADRLLSNGVSPGYVKRTITELQEHYSDLHDEALKRGLSSEDAKKEALSRLGKEDDLAAEVLTKPALRSWASRWPWAVYGLGPIFAACLSAFVYLLMYVPILIFWKKLIGTGYVTPAWLPHLTDSLSFTVACVFPLLIVAWVCRQVVLRRDSLSWPLAGLVILCIVTAAIDITMKWPTSVDAAGSLSFSFGYIPPFPLTVETLVRTLANLGFTVIMMTWCRKKSLAQHAELISKQT